jgi:hypothetical protein
VGGWEGWTSETSLRGDDADEKDRRRRHRGSAARLREGPMRAIPGWVAMLKMPDLDAAEAAEALAVIESSTEVRPLLPAAQYLHQQTLLPV